MANLSIFFILTGSDKIKFFISVTIIILIIVKAHVFHFSSSYYSSSSYSSSSANNNNDIINYLCFNPFDNNVKNNIINSHSKHIGFHSYLIC